MAEKRKIGCKFKIKIIENLGVIDKKPRCNSNAYYEFKIAEFEGVKFYVREKKYSDDNITSKSYAFAIDAFYWEYSLGKFLKEISLSGCRRGVSN